MKGVHYDVSAKVWKHQGGGGWFFISVDRDVSDEIRKLFKSEEEGWGRLKATAKINSFEWPTSIWFDTKLGVYLLPVKATIRKKANISEGDEIQVEIWI